MELGRLFSGEVVIDRNNSHIHDEEELIELLSEALSQISADGRDFFVEEIDFGRVIGETICVETTSTDQIIFAQRPKRAGLTRFVLNRVPESCSCMVVILKKAQEDNCYIIITAFVGYTPQPEPWDKILGNDKQAQEKSLDFWSTHALVWGEEMVIPGTETNKCPW